jgi:alpha-amylase
MNLSQPNHHPVRNLVLYFQVHQPLRLKAFRFFDIGSGSSYFDETLNRDILERITRECYLPANQILLKLIRKHPGLRVAFSISGVTLDQWAVYTPEVIDSFKALASTGSVEFFCETSYHSLAGMLPGDEFETQIRQHADKLYKHFGVTPSVFRNTELIYSDEIGKRISDLGFKATFCDGIEKILQGRSPHYLYQHPQAEGFKLFLRNYRLSDDIAFRFRQGKKTLQVSQYLSWLDAVPKDEPLVNIAMDYETFGEHQKKESGILDFFEKLLKDMASSPAYRMLLPSEAAAMLPAREQLSVPHVISWADTERNLSAWLGNAMQQDAFDTLYTMEKELKKLNDSRLLTIWRYLQTSDHFYYMSTKKDDDGNVHSYFSHYPSPYEAFMNYMNVLSDFRIQVDMKRALQAQDHSVEFA